MTVLVMNSDGTSSEIGGVHWHPECVKTIGPGVKMSSKGSLWTTKDKVLAHYAKINEYREQNGITPRNLEFVLDGIECASAPLEIYHGCEDGKPWLHTGLLVRDIPYGGSDSFWDNRV